MGLECLRMFLAVIFSELVVFKANDHPTVTGKPIAARFHHEYGESRTGIDVYHIAQFANQSPEPVPGAGHLFFISRKIRVDVYGLIRSRFQWMNTKDLLFLQELVKKLIVLDFQKVPKHKSGFVAGLNLVPATFPADDFYEIAAFGLSQRRTPGRRFRPEVEYGSCDFPGLAHLRFLPDRGSINW